MALAGAVAAVGCGPEPPEWRPPTAERAFTPWEVETLWKRGGVEEDTVLYGPWAVRGAQDRAVVLDWGAQRVRAFDAHTGAVLWSFGGPGEGPGEFRNPVDVVPLADGSTVVWDLAIGRLTWITAGGRIAKMLSPEVSSTPGRFCELADGSLVALQGSPDEAVSVLTEQAVLRPLDELPWPELARLDPIQRQAEFAAGPGGRCVFYLTQSTGFARVTRDGFGPTHDFVEPMAPPSADVQRSPTSERVALGEYRLAVQAGFIRERELWLAFHGESELASRQIDVFDIESGEYLRSYALPGPVSGIGVAGEVLFFLASEGGYPILVAVRAPWA